MCCSALSASKQMNSDVFTDSYGLLFKLITYCVTDMKSRTRERNTNLWNTSLKLRAVTSIYRSELLGQFRLIGGRASDVSGGRICLTQNAYAEI